MAIGRLASLTAPFIATYSDVTTSAPIWVACACFAAIGSIGLVLPVDTVPFWSPFSMRVVACITLVTMFCDGDI